MISTYPVARLSDIASDISYGYTASSQSEPNGPKLLRITDIAQERLDWNSVPYCRITDSDKAKFRLSPGDIVIARTGATVGHSKTIGQGPEAVYASYLIRVRVVQEHDPTYVGYVIGSPNYKQFVLANAGGAAQPNANAKVLTSYSVPIPPLSTQHRIAAILSGFDDSIENNYRRVKLLEEMAGRIYHEWFVEFRYPGHGALPLVESALGSIPQTWIASTVGDVAVNFDRQRKPLSGIERKKRPGVFPYYGAARVVDSIDDYLFDGTYLLVAEDGSVITPEGFPVLQYVNGKFWANNHTHIMRGRLVSTEYLYMVLRNQPINGYITGAAQPKITQANLNRIPCLLPSPPMLRDFDDLVQPMFSLIQALESVSANLRTIRDLLLPRLVSGEIDVDNLDIQFPDAA